MLVLALNCGSSSVKWLLAAEREGSGGAKRVADGHATGASTEVAVAEMLDELRRRDLLQQVEASGHRIVHGGDRFVRPVIVDDDVLAQLDHLSDLAPLHNPPALAGLRAVREALGPKVPAVAAFDTAFHADLPPPAAHYAVPARWADVGIRRFGFHGLAHRYLAERLAALSGRPLTELRAVTLQLGAGCSAAAIEGGRSVETSMGFTPNEGLLMSTRSGDVSPDAAWRAATAFGLDAAGIESELNHRSGLAALAGTGDMQEVVDRAAAGDAAAANALAAFCHRARRYLGGYLAVLGGADAIAFGGGIGEHAAEVREQILVRMEWAGLVLDSAANRAADGREARISTGDSRIAAWVVPVDEQVVIARDVVAALSELG